jgi:hypothetical protein
MWIFLRDSFLSIVEHERETRLLDVRASMRGDIERVFPEADVVEIAGGDYRFRTSLPRERVGQAIALRVGKINYHELDIELAGSDPDRLKSYLNVWTAMYDEQIRLYGPKLDPARDSPSERIELDAPVPNWDP